MISRNILLPVAVFLQSVISVHACSMCGCQSSMNFTGLLNYTSSNFISLQALLNRMHSVDDVTGGNIESEYNNLMLAGALQIKPGIWDMQFYLPYAMNSYDVSEGNVFSLNGIGDAGWTNQVVLFQNSDSALAFWRLNAKIGVEIPTGKFYHAYREVDVPAAISVGSGSWDILSGLRFSYFKNKLGIYADYLFKYNTENAYAYKYGNQHVITALASYQLEKGKVTVTPMLGSMAEFIAFDTFYGYDQHGTSGTNVYGLAGLDINIRKINVGVNINLPVYSVYDNEASAALRGSVHAGYTF